MKQGTGSNTTHRKDSFVANAVNPKAVARFGINSIDRSPPKCVTSSVQQPPASARDSHKSGSQGRH